MQVKIMGLIIISTDCSRFPDGFIFSRSHYLHPHPYV
eukprot:COSAG01_NODE_69294_length_261_cov_2.987654_1_plen_36_part_10